MLSSRKIALYSYPFGMLAQNYNAKSYLFGFNTQERTDEISGTGNHNTALFWEYNTRLGRRWNIDPKPQVFISDYAVLGNNPIWYTDYKGDTIKIAYKENKGVKRLFEKTKYYTYMPGESYTGDNKFVGNTVKALNYVKEGDVMGIIDKISNNEEIIKIKKTRVGNDHYNPGRNTLKYNSQSGLKVIRFKDEDHYIDGAQTPALGLLHELGHGYVDLYFSEDKKKEMNEYDNQYDDQEERWVIENIETPAAEILGEGSRNNHSGLPFKTKGPITTEESK